MQKPHAKTNPFFYIDFFELTEREFRNYDSTTVVKSFCGYLET